MVRLGPARGPKRAGPENPGPRALRAETGLMIFYLRFLCALCAGHWVVTRELCNLIFNNNVFKICNIVYLKYALPFDN